MFILGPNDSPVKDSKSSMTHSNFGGRRQVTEGVEKAEDYTKPSLERRANMAADVEEKIINPVDETTRDVDDLNDPQVRKNDTTRQVKSFEVADSNTEHFHVSDLENKPLDEGREDSAFQTPGSDKPHGSNYPFNPYFDDATGTGEE
jgi:hypothetical protein